MSDPAELPEFDEIPSLSDVLSDFTPRAPGRPRKGEEKDHGVDVALIEAHVDAEERGLTVLHGQEGGKGVQIQKENTRHRTLLYIFAQGGTVRNVFEQLGGQWDETLGKPISGTGEYSYQHLLNIRKQPWFQNELLEVVQESGMDLVQAKLALEVMASIETQIEIRDNKNNSAAVRLASSNSLLDRFLGKPTQTVKTEAPASTAAHENEANALRERLQRLEQEAHNINPAFKPPSQS